MKTISEKMRFLLLQHRGMLSIKEMSDVSGVNRFTLTDILTGKRTIVRDTTFDKLNDWLYKQI
ncbi:helix-turn-helix domain-containing protein [Lactiplantibacillus plantarum]|uniref:hypothetical protein n=1 Tax=Lactiplantibacillus plantarum TaxID=1590 RepID=UPI00192D2B23|nr:hypothetical protein [Lactiplantibacillus plantarum]MCG0723864.1 helix-turn-helix domain-containing protein [Lactiplantibacillus plantarum]QRA41100.1 hypothetical protein JMO19_11175 [Lactiplantibacillus plantarum]